MAAILEINHLCKDFGALNILNDVNVSIDEGDFLVLVGPSGCGKSTLLNCIAGLEPITSGSIAIDGKDMTHISPKDPRYCHGVPILRPLPDHERRAQHHFWHESAGGGEGGADAKTSHRRQTITD